ncbi:hypothetical protein ASG43_03275 [Aureimonas sp. Leaf454]|nr:hypothetical protein ASG43_03275 [Aureimonas sp. Leaf454]
MTPAASSLRTGPAPSSVTRSITADRGERVTSGTVGRQSSTGGVYANGGTNSGLPGASPAATAPAAAGKTGRVGTGLAAGLTSTPTVGRVNASGGVYADGSTDSSFGKAPKGTVGRTSSVGGVYANGGTNTGLPGTTPPATSRFGENVPAAKGPTGLASALKTQQLPGNYGADFAPAVRAANKISDDRLGAWDGALASVRKAEAQKAPNPKTGKPDAYNGLVGPKKGKKTPTHADLENMTIAEVMSYQKGMLRDGHLSTAVGAYQIMRDTLPEVAAQAGMDINKTRFTKATQDQLARTLADDKRATQAARSRKGLTPETYARTLAQEWAGLAVEDGRSYYAGDGLNKATVGYGETLAAARNLVNSGAVGDARLDGTAPGPVSAMAPGRTDRVTAAPKNVPSPTARPGAGKITDAVRAAATRRGVDPQAVADYADRYGIDPNNAALAVSPATQQGYTANVGFAADGTPIPGKAMGMDVAVAAPATNRFGEKYLSPASQPAPAAAKKERTLPDKVLAGAIDVGIGMVPGIGTAAGLYGLAAPLLGLPTVGDMALNLRDKNTFDLAASLRGGNASRGSQGEGTAPPSSIPPTAKNEEEAPAPAAQASTSSFAAKYLGFSDPTPRPTPEQKWGSSGANSVAYAL